MADQQFCLRWNNHQVTLVSIFDTLLQGDRFTDCTLSAEGQCIAAHKILLTACSPYFDTILSNIRYDRHPVIVLKDVKFSELQAIMDYMYRGEVNVSQDQLAALLKVAESLQIKGLSDTGISDKPRVAPPLPAVPRTSSANRSLAQVHDTPVDSPNLGSSNASPVPRGRRTSKRRRYSSGDDTSQTLANTMTESLDSNNSHDMSNISVAQVADLLSKPTAVIPPPAPAILNQPNIPENAHVSVDIPKIEPDSQDLLQPKEEYVDDQDSVENITLDDDDDMDNMDYSQAGPSHGDGSSQGYPSYNNDGTTDEVFMAAQEAVGGQQRDSQGPNESTISGKKPFHCLECGKSYTASHHLSSHRKYECGKEPQCWCPHCPYRAKLRGNLRRHLEVVHHIPREVAKQLLDSFSCGRVC